MWREVVLFILVVIAFSIPTPYKPTRTCVKTFNEKSLMTNEDDKAILDNAINLWMQSIMSHRSDFRLEGISYTIVKGLGADLGEYILSAMVVYSNKGDECF